MVVFIREDDVHGQSRPEDWYWRIEQSNLTTHYECELVLNVASAGADPANHFLSGSDRRSSPPAIHVPVRRHCEVKLVQVLNGVVAQMPVAAEVGSGDERDELGSG